MFHSSSELCCDHHYHALKGSPSQDLELPRPRFKPHLYNILVVLLRPILLLLRYPLTNKQRVLVQKCPWWQIIHYSWMNEINALCLSFSNHNDSARDRKAPTPFRSLYTNSTIEYHGSSISPGLPPSTSLGPDFPSGKDLNTLGMCFLFKLQVKIQFTFTHCATGFVLAMEGYNDS